MTVSEAQARRALQALLEKYKALIERSEPLSEADVEQQLIVPLLRDVLGWPVEEASRFKRQLSTQTGRPDMVLFPEQGGTVFVEAKRLGVIKELDEARNVTEGAIPPDKLAQTVMTTDRTREEQQAINYAFENGGTWAILTNFEKLRLFNARRDWLVFSFERPYAYLDAFDDLWQLAYPNICQGSLDALNSRRWTRDIDAEYLAIINKWRARLAQDMVQHRERNRWAFHPDGRVNLPLLRATVQLFLDRLVIVRFAEDHYVIPAGAFRQFYDLRVNNPYTRPMDEYLDHFFRRFNEDHNSVLFAESEADRAFLSDAVLLPLIEDLYRVRYRSMPADILGNTYEQYLGKTLGLDDGNIVIRDNLETRKKQGTYYTPQVIVRYLVDHSLGRYLYGTANGRPDGQPVPGETRKTSADIRNLRILDSACGSGSFLIYAYQMLAEFYESESARLKAAYEARVRDMAAQFESISTDDRIAAERLQLEAARIQDYPRLILETHLYGVDLDPQAAEIATVNLMMRAMERRQRDQRLPPILGQNVKIGNSLVGVRHDDPALDAHRARLGELVRLRRRLHSDPDKDIELPRLTERSDRYRTMSLEDAQAIPNPAARQKAIEEVTRRMEAPPPEPARDPTYASYYEVLDKTQAVNDALNGPFAAHFSDLERARPFHWAVEFPEVFCDEDGKPLPNPGFDVILGNPPWEILKPDLREFYAQFDPAIESKLTRQQAERRIAELEHQDPRRAEQYAATTSHIEDTAAWVHRSADYTRQGRGDTATHKLFVERMYGLLRQDGRLGYIIPSGIYSDLGARELRETLFETGQIDYLYGLANVRKFFPDVDSRFKFTLLGVKKGGRTEGFRTLFLLSHAEWPQIMPERDASAILQEVLDDETRVFEMSVGLVRRFSPDSLSVMEFQTQQAYRVAEKVYADWPLLGDEVPGLWNARFTAEFHMTNDRDLFNTQGQGLPLYEGKMFHQFDAYFAEPRFWIEEGEGRKRLENKTGNDYLRARLAFRDIARSTDERAYIAAVLPPKVFVGNTGIVETLTQGKEMLFLLAMLNSFCNDYLIRYKISTHVNMFYAYQLPMPRLTAGNAYFDAIVPRAARLTCARAEFAALWQEVMGGAWRPSPPAPLPQGEGGSGANDPAERQRLRDELDAIIAHLYGLGREDFDHILGTFPLVFPDNDAGWAKREALLRVYDAWAGRLG